ncbi:hypothetical protein [Massilia putida]|uniref:hypothetical protein n=1 Tax=Massilia putida TaxID=1141883 RepID=UPI000953099B|nr:hypothetical protein [Massilia putida]
MSGFTILKAHIRLKCPVDSEIDHGLRLITSEDRKAVDDKIDDPADQDFLETAPFYLMQGRITYDGRYVVVNAQLKNKRHDLEEFLLWLAPSVESVEDGTWYDEENIDDETFELSFAAETGKFLLRGPNQERELITEPWRPAI